ncbi:MAG: HNH endonuclease [Micromonosporaceae bacterium]
MTIDPNFKGDHTTDFTEANRQADLPETPDGYTWHHHQDTRTMQLVPEDMHRAVNHGGGVAIMKGRKAPG